MTDQGRRQEVRQASTSPRSTVARRCSTELGVEVDKHDMVKPALDTADRRRRPRSCSPGSAIVTKHVDGEAIDFGTVEHEDSSMFEGETSVERAGVGRRRDVTYRLTYRNGQLVARKVVSQQVTRASRSPRSSRSAPRSPRPPTSPAATPSGTPSRSASPAATGPSTPATATTAACSSRSAPGRPTAAPATPPAQPRDADRASPTRLRDASGGYGAWPGCAAKLGLPADPATASRHRPTVDRTTRLTPCLTPD